jgi:hypothetical protein
VLAAWVSATWYLQQIIIYHFCYGSCCLHCLIQVRRKFPLSGVIYCHSSWIMSVSLNCSVLRLKEVICNWKKKMQWLSAALSVPGNLPSAGAPLLPPLPPPPGTIFFFQSGDDLFLGNVLSAAQWPLLCYLQRIDCTNKLLHTGGLYLLPNCTTFWAPILLNSVKTLLTILILMVITMKSFNTEDSFFFLSDFVACYCLFHGLFNDAFLTAE